MTEDYYFTSYDILNVTDITKTEDILHTNGFLQSFVIILSAAVTITGFLQNSLVLLVIFRQGLYHKVTNIFIASLAISDIVLCVFNLPFQLHYQLTDFWPTGEVLCRIIMPAFGVPVFYSTICMMVIAADRYVLIAYPFKTRISKKMAILIIFVTVLISFSLTTPVMIHTKYDILNVPIINLHKIYCYEDWTGNGNLIYTFIIFFLQVVIPLLVTAVLYYKIHRALQKRPIKRSETRRNNKTNKLLLAIVLFFVISWFPWNIFNLLVSLDYKVVYGPYYKLVDLLLRIVAMSSACINPLLYGWLNDNIRNEVSSFSRKLRTSIRYSRSSERAVTTPV